MQVKDIMTTNVISLSPDMSIDRAAAVLFDNNLTGAPVLSFDNKLIGIVTEYDFISPDLKIHIPTYIKLLKSLELVKKDREAKPLQQELEKIKNTKVEDIMTRDVITVSPEGSIEDLIDLIIKNRINPVPVLDEQKKLVGIVSRADLVKILKNISL